MKKNKKEISANDHKLLACAISSNNLSVKVHYAQSIANDVSEVDLILLDNKTLARQYRQLKNALNKAALLSEQISSTFYNI